MVKRFLLSLALVVLFALGQQGAVLHEISHIAEISGDLNAPSHKAPHSPLCEKCIAYGELANAVSASDFLLALVALTHEAPSLVSTTCFTLASFAYSARAPPLFV